MRRIKKLVQLFKYRKALSQSLFTHLSLLKKDGIADALGGLTEQEEQFVRSLVREYMSAGVSKDGEGEGKGNVAGPIVEFGTLFGLTTQLLAETAPKGVTILTIDMFCWNPFGLPPDLHRQFTQRILRPYLESGRVQLIDQDSFVFRQHYEGVAPSMVFLDADHSYAAVRDEIAWSKKVNSRVISGHDYGNCLFGVTRAVDEAFPDGVQCRGMVWAYCGH